MIVPISHYRKFFQNDDESLMASKMTDEYIKVHGVVCFGEVDQAGNCFNFSTEQKPSDTHVLIGMNIQEMGFEAPRATPIKSSIITDQDIQRARDAQEARIARMREDIQRQKQQLADQQREITLKTRHNYVQS